MINDGWHVLQRILIKGTMFLLKVISAGLNGWKKKKKLAILWVSIIDIAAINFYEYNTIIPDKYIIYNNYQIIIELISVI